MSSWISCCWLSPAGDAMMTRPRPFVPPDVPVAQGTLRRGPLLHARLTPPFRQEPWDPAEEENQMWRFCCKCHASVTLKSRHVNEAMSRNVYFFYHYCQLKDNYHSGKNSRQMTEHNKADFYTNAQPFFQPSSTIFRLGFQFFSCTLYSVYMAQQRRLWRFIKTM